MKVVTFDDVDLAKLASLTDQMLRVFPGKLTIGLVGTLGAGKTTLTQRLAEAMGIDPSDVTSPTFTLLSSYTIDRPGFASKLHHLDAYRVHDEDEFLELGIDELLDDDDCWVVIEWADRVEAVMPDETLWINIETSDSSSKETPSRRIMLRTNDPRLAKCLDDLKTTHRN